MIEREMLIMERNIMIAGSYPTIITSGGNPRVNKSLIDNPFLRKYVSLFGELLKVKGNLSDIKITYIGGYTKEDNVSRAKLYISAYNYYLNDLGYGQLSKNNLTVVDVDNVEETLESIEQCDLLFLGIGADSKFARTLFALEKRGINLNELIKNKNILVSSICSGSVMSAERIYGGLYDHYYYGQEPYEYPFRIQSLGINPVTMETDFFPNDATTEKNEEFVENYLKPDSNRCVFFACKPNSLFLIGEEKVYSYGEMYLFIDGEILSIESEFQTSDVTELVALVNQYNQIKNKRNVFDNELLAIIKRIVQSLIRTSVENVTSSEKNIAYEFVQKEKAKGERDRLQVNEWRQALKLKLDYLFSEENLVNFRADLGLQGRFKRLDENVIEEYHVDRSTDYLEELYLKMTLVSFIKKSYIEYQGYYSDFKKDLYDLLCSYISRNDRLVYYVVDTCGSLFSNRELKQVLNVIKVENARRPQQIIDSTEKQKKLFRKEMKHERS